MKLLVAVLISAAVLGTQKCKQGVENKQAACYKGRLEIKGICGNYTIKLLEGKLDTALLDAAWKDEVSGKTYNNVFGLASACSFPERLNAGDEFYFTLNPDRESCNVCMAYYPTPAKKIAIKVLDGPCR